MGSMGRPIQPKKIITPGKKNLGPGGGSSPGADNHLGEIKRVCAKCGNIWQARPNPFGPIKCPKCKTIIVGIK